MAQERYVTPEAIPRKTGNVKTDVDLIYRYMFPMVAELKARLEAAEKKLRKLEKAAKE